MDINSVLKEVRGAATSFHKITQEDFEKYKNKEDEWTFDDFKSLLLNLELDINKFFIVDNAFINYLYFIDKKEGLYINCILSKEYIEDIFLKGYKQINKRDTDVNWKKRYLFIPDPFKIYDFQNNYKNIDKNSVYDIWEYVYASVDYSFGIWDKEVLDYVFKYAPKVHMKEDTVTVYRGMGTSSTSINETYSWTLNPEKAFFFATKNKEPIAIYKALVNTDKIKAFITSGQEEECIIYPEDIENLEKIDMIVPSLEYYKENLLQILDEYKFWGENFNINSYKNSGCHGVEHVLRVMYYALCSGLYEDITKREQLILIYYSLLHDIGRVNDFEDYYHGKLSNLYINSNNIKINNIELNDKEQMWADFLIEYHCKPDDMGFKRIKQLKINEDEKERLSYLFKLAKDLDGLDRVRTRDMNINFMRTNFGKKFPFVASFLYDNKIENIILEK